MTEGLWPPQITAIENLEQSLARNKPRALIQMATGSGKRWSRAAYRSGLRKGNQGRSGGVRRSYVDRIALSCRGWVPELIPAVP